MKQTIETRELFVLDSGDGVVRGTYHSACNDNSCQQPNSVEPNRVGIVFLNSLTPTRAATGDSAVYWADSFAKCGYPSFRFDPPGFGDSDGDPPADLASYINTGGYAPTASSNISELERRFKVSGVVIVGLCAGAVSALYTAAASKACRGVVLMDPYFFVPMVNATNAWQKVKRKFINRMSRSTLGRRMVSIYDRLAALLPGTALPSDANIPLLNCWEKVLSAGIPILLLRAPHTSFKRGKFDYLDYILDLAGAKSQVQVKVIDGTGHSFANRVGRTAVREQTESWLNSCFPLKKSGKVGGNAMLPKSHNAAGSNCVTRITCMAKICSGV